MPLLCSSEQGQSPKQSPQQFPQHSHQHPDFPRRFPQQSPQQFLGNPSLGAQFYRWSGELQFERFWFSVPTDFIWGKAFLYISVKAKGMARFQFRLQFLFLRHPESSGNIFQGEIRRDKLTCTGGRETGDSRSKNLLEGPWQQMLGQGHTKGPG